MLKAKEKNCLYLHFTMRDNPSLTPAILKRYETLYSGAFYERFVEGKWVAAQGLVYPMFGSHLVAEPPQDCGSYYLSCDYGTVNPFSCGLWGEREGTWYRLREYYYDSRREGRQKRTRNTMPSWKHWSADCPYMPSSWTLPQQVLSPASAAIKPIVRFRRKMRCWTASGGCRMP